MRAITALVFLGLVACAGGGAKSGSSSPDSPNAKAGPKASAPGEYCTKFGICYKDVSRDNYSSDEELACEQYCTYYCSCYEAIEGEECYEGGGCAMACEGELAKEDRREDWIRRLRCAQEETACKRFMDEC